LAAREVIILTDDLDGTDGAETVQFSVDGTSYEIELAPKNRARFDKALAPYLESARRIPKPRKRRTA
jgi:hypothetical protein